MLILISNIIKIVDMKKYSLIYILLVTLFLTSCNDFLKETNYSGLSDEPFYSSEVGIEALV